MLNQTRRERITILATPKVDVKELLKAGAHFGHRPNHWNPAMRPYIHSLRGGIYIIDLIKTAAQIELALEFAQKIASAGQQILFVGTKRHTRDAVRKAALNCGMPYVSERWLGGTLTNFTTINRRVKHLKDMEAKFESGELAQTFNKREVGEMKADMAKMNLNFGGVKDMPELPAALFVADVVSDKIAVREAYRLGVPIIGIVDTNGDPTIVSHVIPANDDALSTVKLISDLLAEAIKSAPKTPPKPAESAADVPKTPSIKTAKVAPKPSRTKPAAKAKPATKPKAVVGK